MPSITRRHSRSPWGAGALLALLTLCACSPNANNRAPVVQPGSDQNVIVGSPVTLDGSASHDPDGDTLSYRWTLTSHPTGSTATLQGAETPKATFVPDVAGTFVATLEVSDAKQSVKGSVKVNASMNGAPNLSTLADQRTSSGRALDVAFTVSDEDPTGVSVIASSDDTTLVAASGLTVSGSGAERTLRITPTFPGIGAVQITLVARDAQGLESSGSFRLDVTKPFGSVLPRIDPSDGGGGDAFGRSVALSGDVALVGAPYKNEPSFDEGVAYVLTRSGGLWTESLKLTASDGGVDDFFGYSVALDGDIALVGAYGDVGKGVIVGAAYVFERNGNVWSERAKLTASDGEEQDLFGFSVALSGDVALVGAPYEDAKGDFAGAVYLFTRSGDVWTEVAKLTASDGEAGDVFGWEVALDGDVALVGARGDDDKGDRAGAAYVFTRSGDVWTESAKLTASDGKVLDFFGYSVAIAGDVALVGALHEDSKGDDAGAAYVFNRNGSTWTEVAKLTASDGEAEDRFGYSVAIAGDVALIGASGDDDKGDLSGAAYIFENFGSGWKESAKLTAGDGAAGDQLGRSVALDGDVALIGAPGSNVNGSMSGAVYLFTH